MSDDVTKPDLSTCTIDELVEELANRYDSYVILGEMPSKTGDTHNTQVRWDGSANTCLGLAQVFSADLTRQMLGVLKERE